MNKRAELVAKLNAAFHKTRLTPEVHVALTPDELKLAVSCLSDPVAMPYRSLSPHMLADAFDCVWNAAIGVAHRQEGGFPTASILAESFSAMSARLRQFDGEATNDERRRAAELAADAGAAGYIDVGRAHDEDDLLLWVKAMRHMAED